MDKEEGERGEAQAVGENVFEEAREIEKRVQCCAVRASKLQ